MSLKANNPDKFRSNIKKIESLLEDNESSESRESD